MADFMEIRMISPNGAKRSFLVLHWLMIEFSTASRSSLGADILHLPYDIYNRLRYLKKWYLFRDHIVMNSIMRMYFLSFIRGLFLTAGLKNNYLNISFDERPWLK